MRICKFTHEKSDFFVIFVFFGCWTIFDHHYSGQKCASFLKMNKGTHNICTGWHVTFLPHFRWQFFFSLVLFLASADFVNENLPFFSRKNWSNSSVILRSYFFLFSTLYYGPYFHCKHILILVDILSKKTPKNDFFGLYYIVFWEQNRIYDKK